MKHLSIFILVLVALLIISGCTSSVYYTGLRPADISLPAGTKSIVLLNRYKPEKQNRWRNIVEGIFTGEILFADRYGVEQALAGLQNRLQDGPKFKVVIANEELSGSGTGQFPPPLTPAIIQNLCTQNSAEVLAAIEAFDSDISVSTAPKQKKRMENGKEVIDNYFEAVETISVTIGWRLYLNTSGAVIEQFQTNNSMSFSATGLTAKKARAGLLFPVDAIMKTGYEGGDKYGLHIAPSWVNYNRIIYNKASRSQKMKAAKRMAVRGDWKEAAEIWEELSRAGKRKIAKRATYNRAVAAEIDGDFDTALLWAKKAADTYHLKRANSYIITLNRRLYELKRLDKQMKE